MIHLAKYMLFSLQMIYCMSNVIHDSLSSDNIKRECLMGTHSANTLGNVEYQSSAIARVSSCSCYFLLYKF